MQGKKVLILGSGGASKAARCCLADLGPAACITISRSGPERYEDLDRHADADVIVNCTPVGMWPDALRSPVDLDLFPTLSGVIDLIYNPLRTQLVMDAEARGIPAAGGLSMLAAQALFAEERFLDRSLPTDLICGAVSEILKRTLNIVLIGMPGSGKTMVGRALSRLTGRPLVDTDEMVVQAAGRSIPELFAQEGEAAFRALEREAVRTAGAMRGVIIATGGGVVTDERNLAPLHQNGTIFHLQRDIALLPTEGRPLSAGPTSLEDLFRRRQPLYEAFRDVTIENSGTAEETAALIWRDLCENTCDQWT